MTQSESCLREDFLQNFLFSSCLFWFWERIGCWTLLLVLDSKDGTRKNNSICLLDEIWQMKIRFLKTVLTNKSKTDYLEDRRLLGSMLEIRTRVGEGTARSSVCWRRIGIWNIKERIQDLGITTFSMSMFDYLVSSNPVPKEIVVRSYPKLCFLYSTNPKRTQYPTSATTHNGGRPEMPKQAMNDSD